MATVGDVGYVDEEGWLYLTDRKTFMIISGGVNIYPQECENVLITHPAVADVAVFGVPNADLGEEVKAVVQPMPGIEPTPELAQELIAFCHQQLSKQKCPRSVDFEEELPRLPDRQALQAAPAGQVLGGGGRLRPVSADIVIRLVGVYDADGTLLGELRYWFGKRLGHAHCALCDITHGSVRERSDWKRCRAGLPVPFETYHRDDQPAEVREVTAGRLPAVVAVTDEGVRFLLGPDELEACSSAPEQLVTAIDATLVGLGLRWPEAHG